MVFFVAQKKSLFIYLHILREQPQAIPGHSLKRCFKGHNSLFESLTKQAARMTPVTSCPHWNGRAVPQTPSRSWRDSNRCASHNGSEHLRLPAFSPLQTVQKAAVGPLKVMLRFGFDFTWEKLNRTFLHRQNPTADSVHALVPGAAGHLLGKNLQPNARTRSSPG